MTDDGVQHQVNLFGVTLTVGQLFTIICGIFSVLSAGFVWVFSAYVNNNKEEIQKINTKIDTVVIPLEKRTTFIELTLPSVGKEIELVKSQMRIYETNSQNTNAAIVDIRADLRYLIKQYTEKEQFYDNRDLRDRAARK